MADEIRLEVDGETFAGWTEVRIMRSYKQFVPTFELAYVDRWFGQERWPIMPGAECALYYGSHLLLTGYVNRATWQIDANGYRLSAGGRAKTQDLVDCSATHSAGQWRHTSMRKIAADLCSPFGIAVQLSEPDTQNFKRFLIDEGETVFDAISRMATLRGYLPATHPSGALLLIRTERVGRSLDLPVADAIARSLQADDQNRYSEYRLKAQTGGDDEHHGAATALQRFEVTDPGVTRFRPLVIVSGGPGHRKELEAQARYERNVRAGQAAQATYTFPGILAPDGRPWAPGIDASVLDPELFTDRRLLVTEVEHTITVEAPDLRTVVTLNKAEMFTVLDFPPRDRKAVI